MADGRGVVADLGGGERLLAALDAVEEVPVVARGAAETDIVGAQLDLQQIGLAGLQRAAVDVHEDPAVVAHELDAARSVARADHPTPLAYCT